MSMYGFPPYVPVAQRRAQARRHAAKAAKKGEVFTPVELCGRTISSTFWGKAWCTNLESYSDFENRLPRGRTYVRNGSVVDLKVSPGTIKALVSGSSLYSVTIKIKNIPTPQWKKLSAKCAGGIDSLVELLQGKFSSAVMQIMSDHKTGLFPAPKEIEMKCSCPDWATMCKHCAAVLYGVGARLDDKPELLFVLRGVDHHDLLNVKTTLPTTTTKSAKVLSEDSVANIFGIELDTPAEPPAPAAQASSARTRKKKLERKRRGVRRK